MGKFIRKIWKNGDKIIDKDLNRIEEELEKNQFIDYYDVSYGAPISKKNNLDYPYLSFEWIGFTELVFDSGVDFNGDFENVEYEKLVYPAGLAVHDGRNIITSIPFKRKNLFPIAAMALKYSGFASVEDLSGMLAPESETPIYGLRYDIGELKPKVIKEAFLNKKLFLKVYSMPSDFSLEFVIGFTPYAITGESQEGEVFEKKIKTIKISPSEGESSIDLSDLILHNGEDFLKDEEDKRYYSLEIYLVLSKGEVEEAKQKLRKLKSAIFKKEIKIGLLDRPNPEKYEVSEFEIFSSSSRILYSINGSEDGFKFEDWIF